MRSKVIIAAFCLVLLSPVVLYGAQKLSPVELPSWLTSVDAEYLEGTKAAVSVRESLTLEGFASGELQESAEAKVRKFVPCRAAALLGNAALQRTFIASSNALFGWECYPTFYGSEHVYSPGDGFLCDIPSKDPKSDSYVMSRMPMDEIAAAYDAMAAKFPDVDFYAYQAMRSEALDDSPAASLVSDAWTFSSYRESLFNEMESIDIIDSWISYEDYKNLYFRTEHHWTIDGAYDAYCRIVEHLGLGDPLERGARVVYEEPLSYGSYVRKGLDADISDTIFDYEFDIPSVEISINSKEVTLEGLAHRERYDNGGFSANVFVSRYGDYFHGDCAEIVLRNTSDEQPERDALMIVGDSYSNPIERLFAAHYKTVYAYDARYNESTIQEYLNEHPDIEDVLFLMHSGNFVTKTSVNTLQLSE